MAAGTGATGHGAADADTIQTAHVTQILERLGITLTDHLGGHIAIKHRDQLPGIAIGGAAVFRCGIVVGNSIADIFLVSFELFVIRFGGIGCNHLGCIVFCCSDLSHIRCHCISTSNIIL